MDIKTSFIHMFNNNVDAYLKETALVCGGMTLTYKDLNQKSGAVAYHLMKEGVKRNDVIVLFLDRTIDLPVCLLGIIKSGATFLPIDTKFPKKRIDYILHDCNYKLILTNNKTKELLAGYEGVIYYEDIDKTVGCQYWNTSIQMDDILYIIYTSGSTGKPKGTLIDGKAFASFIQGIQKKINFSSKKTMLFLTTISFDISILELLLPLINGMKIIIAGDTEARNPYLLMELLMKERIHIVQMTPSAFQLLISFDKELTCMRHVTDLLIGGEAMPVSILDAVNKYTNVNIYNLYGPTEATIWCLVANLTNKREVNIGKPLEGVKLYILNENLEQIAKDEIGELCITGPQLSRGYLNHQEYMASKFIKNPFGEGFLYKTGDLAKYNIAGFYEYIGRNDYQVKIRGYRIELGEIETVITKYPHISKAIVVIRNGKNGNSYLCGYFVAEREIEVRDLINFLKEEIPDYMVPEQLIQLGEFPYTPNLKVDRSALMEYQISY